MVLVNKILYPLHHLAGSRYLFHGFLRIQPAPGIVVAQSHDVRHGDRLVGDRRFFFHAPDNPKAGMLRRDIEVVALGITEKQLHCKARVQPALFLFFFDRGRSCLAFRLGSTFTELEGLPGMNAACCQVIQLLDAAGRRDLADRP